MTESYVELVTRRLQDRNANIANHVDELASRVERPRRDELAKSIAKRGEVPVKIGGRGVSVVRVLG